MTQREALQLLKEHKVVRIHNIYGNRGRVWLRYPVIIFRWKETTGTKYIIHNNATGEYFNHTSARQAISHAWKIFRQRIKDFLKFIPIDSEYHQ